MQPRSFRPLAVMAAMLWLPMTAFAQEAALSGTVTDSTGGVLPGVVVRAVLEETGNSFEAVTDSSGAYRLVYRPWWRAPVLALTALSLATAIALVLRPMRRAPPSG